MFWIFMKGWGGKEIAETQYYMVNVVSLVNGVKVSLGLPPLATFWKLIVLSQNYKIWEKKKSY